MDLVFIAGALAIFALIVTIEIFTSKQEKDLGTWLFIAGPSCLAILFYYMAFAARPGTLGYLAVYGVLGK